MRFATRCCLLLLLSSCQVGPAGESALDDEFAGLESSLTAAQRRVRAGEIRDAAAANGMTQGWLLAGIADAETQMSHCHSELTWACRGPNSVDCGGGPVVAGAGDGPCSIRQGGLGMFQFDAGTFEDTLAREGDRILTIAGNTAAAVDFVVAMVIRSVYIDGVSNRDQAIAWMNGVRVGNAQWDPWVRTVTHYYNGCRPGRSCFDERYGRYRDFSANVRTEMGEDFWGMSGGGGSEWEASFVAQTFPFAADPFELAAGEEFSGAIALRNDGSATWRPGEVFLGTTEPRDGASPIEAAGWISSNRAATVQAITAPGAVGRFEFAVRGPAASGDYPQHFNLVREGVTWFSAPRDDQLEVRVTVTSSSCPGDTSARWACDGDLRRRCVGTVEEEACEHGCVSDDEGAVCASPPRDGDGDGFFGPDDCDDSDPNVYPGAPDPCGDRLDANCDDEDRCMDEGGGWVDAGVEDGGPSDGPGTGPDSRPGAEGCAIGGSSSNVSWLAFPLLALWMRRRRFRSARTNPA